MTLLWRRRSELHPDQIAAIEKLPARGRYLLLGPPGSGKTSILLHRGHYLRLTPNGLTNTRLITFSRTLREFIAVSGDERFPPPLIDTMKSFIDGVYEGYGERMPPLQGNPNLAEQNRIKAENILEILRSKERRLEFDALLVDEIQDLSASEVDVLCELSDNVMLAGDSRQRIFEPTGAYERALELGFEVVPLKHHFRISPEICRVADAILVQGEDFRMSEYCHYQGPAPTQPLARGGLKRDQQIAALVEALDLQIDTYNDPGDLIGVVVSRIEDCDALFDHLEDLPKFEGRIGVFHSGIPDRAFRPEYRICIVTVQGCKGIEFRALNWLFVDEDHRLTRERAYTVVTRAKTSLNLYHKLALPDFLAGAFPAPTRGRFDDD